ncbi:MAG: B12-binding domain-containing protein [Candidatus Bathyarchaeia archaeon]
MMKKLSTLIADLEEVEVAPAVRRMLEAGVDALDIVEEIRAGMEIVGQRYEREEYFLSEMLVAAEAAQSAMQLVKPRLTAKPTSLGRVVIGTVQGDIHTIGKNMVASFLECEGFTVYNVGEDVTPEIFLGKVKEVGAEILAMSTLMTGGVEYLKITVKLLEDEGLRGKVRVLVGGNPFFINPERWLEEIGGDAYGRDCREAVKKARELVGG